MRICIDSCVSIQGLQESDPASSELLNLVGDDLVLIVPRLVAQEVTRNLGTPEQVRRFYQLVHDRDSADIVGEPVPRELVVKYSHLGLPEKADAFIGAFAEWQQVRYPVSDNRHFLRDLTTDAFEVLRPADLVSRWQTG